MQSELLGVSSDSAATPRLSFHLHPRAGASASWGVAWYPSDDPNSSFMKDTRFRGDVCINETLPSNERLSTSVIVAHTRAETKRTARCDAQPFRRPYGRTDCVFAHSGDLDLHPDPSSDPADDWLSPIFPPAFEPVGSTDSERVFCRILQRLYEGGASSLGALGWHSLHGWLLDANRHGTLNAVLSNGHDLVAYRDASGARPLWHRRWLPPRKEFDLPCGNHTLTLDAGEDISRTVFVVTSRPAVAEGWIELAPGRMIVIRNGDFLWEGEAPAVVPEPPATLWIPTADARAAQPSATPGPASAGSAPILVESVATPPINPTAPTPCPRTLRVVHETRFTYSEPVAASQHVLRLHPVSDHWQEILEHSLHVSPIGEHVDFEDVFGNQAVFLDFKEPYNELIIRMQSIVRIDWQSLVNLPHQRHSIPLTWMPWQRQMMHAYLLPPELPESQLRELSDYATSFVERRAYDLLETLVDINRSIHRDFAYASGSTNNETTPFEVYATRQGVCQDFANLFICLARLLGVPARYRVGYIYTGSNYENKIQSDATHAWAEAYLPHVGWRGFDPTNGCLAGPDHIRVAVGRNFRDATPTTGTIFKGGQNELMTIGVEVRSIAGEPDDAPSQA